MIFYFSATGNSLHVAKSIAFENEQLIDIAYAMKNKEFRYNINDDRVGIVSPTYDWTLPNIVSVFLENAEFIFQEKPYIFYVGTYGTTIGAAAAMANDILKDKNLNFDAMFDIKMPDTWTPMFDLSDKNHVSKINAAAEIEIGELNRQLAKRLTGKHMGLTTPKFTGQIGKAIYDRNTTKTSNLTVTDSCVGCGMCARKCPVEAIEMRDKKPVWVKEHCVMCLGCLHRCPKFAIQCGKNTEKHGQYVNPHVRNDDCEYATLATQEDFDRL